jgi:hypothetical protein
MSSSVTVSVHLQCRSLQLTGCLDQGLIINITLKPIPVFDALSCTETVIMVLGEPHSWCSTCRDYKRPCDCCKISLVCSSFLPFPLRPEPWEGSPFRAQHGDKNTGSMKSCCSRRTRTGTGIRDNTGHSAWSSVISSDIHVLDGWIFFLPYIGTDFTFFFVIHPL